MTHLTPTIKQAMLKIFHSSNEQVNFIDEDGSICCGRSMILSGNIDSGLNLMRKNKELIEKTGAKTLVTSCPICYRTFVEDYDLDMKVMHHTQYINELIEQKRINPAKRELKVVYHDPCELGRGMGIYDEPRTLLSSVASLQTSKFEKQDALCCGGCIGNSQIQYERRELITRDVIRKMSVDSPDQIVTSCPLCKKTLNRYAEHAVDISQVVADSL